MLTDERKTHHNREAFFSLFKIGRSFENIIAFKRPFLLGIGRVRGSGWGWWWWWWWVARDDTPSPAAVDLWQPMSVKRKEPGTLPPENSSRLVLSHYLFISSHRLSAESKC